VEGRGKKKRTGICDGLDNTELQKRMSASFLAAGIVGEVVNLEIGKDEFDV
jgi:hypothetical protein